MFFKLLTKKQKIYAAISIAVSLAVVLSLAGLITYNQLTGGVDLNKKMEESDQLKLAGDNQAAADLWGEVAEQAKNNRVRFAAYLEKGLAYYEIGEYLDAVEAFQVAESIEGVDDERRENLYRFMAFAYEEMEEYAGAIEYMHKTLALMDSEHPMYEADKEFYESRIEAWHGAR